MALLDSALNSLGRKWKSNFPKDGVDTEERLWGTKDFQSPSYRVQIHPVMQE